MWDLGRMRVAYFALTINAVKFCNDGVDCDCGCCHMFFLILFLRCFFCFWQIGLMLFFFGTCKHNAERYKHSLWDRLIFHVVGYEIFYSCRTLHINLLLKYSKLLSSNFPSPIIITVIIVSISAMLLINTVWGMMWKHDSS